MTRRLIRACENPYVQHHRPPDDPPDRPPRRPVDADWDEVFRAAARTGTAMEINAFPDRLDLPDELILARQAARSEVRHRQRRPRDPAPRTISGTASATAQRGWLTTDDVINTWPLTRLRGFLRKTAVRGTTG